MRRFALALCVAAIPVAAMGFGRDDRWVSGWGMGVAEALVTAGDGNQIYVTCDQGAGRNATGIDFMLAGQSPSGDHVALTFDDDPSVEVSLWDGRIPSDCRACVSTYTFVTERLRAHNRVRVAFENGDQATFTLTGSRAAIVDCTPDFAR